jgi:hypothetical protein
MLKFEAPNSNDQDNIETLLDAAFGTDLDPDDIGFLGDSDRFDVGDFHDEPASLEGFGLLG